MHFNTLQRLKATGIFGEQSRHKIDHLRTCLPQTIVADGSKGAESCMSEIAAARYRDVARRPAEPRRAGTP